MTERRVYVQGHGRHYLRKDHPGRTADARPPGTITWSEHVKAWEAYARQYGKQQSAERMAKRGGFDYGELVDLLGRDPETWEARAGK